MRVGLISDIHANRVALSTVLEDMPAVDRLLCAGDVVGYNPWPAECLDVVRERSVPTVMGNHDRAVASDTAFRFNAMAKAGVEHARRELSEEGLQWLAALPEERTELEGRVKLVHGHPENPDHYTYPEEFSPALLGDEELLVMGHTHVQGHAVYDEGIVCNPGSVGQPRDGDPRAAYAIVDLDERTVEERRVEYDVERVIEAVSEAGLPERIGSRLREGR
ncbi:metallophosphoesterase [Halalkalicoccus sp. NIPERK01]|uniref:metallophosphoesterase family protein n=1 Tax=Halalkalicoccus sp. NIPERK01 TaxID=3053469 RepID=UPI00256F09A3|nr:metallophosphoesterase family protein [Halalkalicoccus sp. NIPERK01]MDL5362924.1 metallophosphoesterase family protein [Halalkalicoccus sp. NIPERK01]